MELASRLLEINFLVIISGRTSTLSSLLLENRIAISIGLISYPLYLIHWPMLSFLHIVNGEDPPFHWVMAAIFLSVIIAWLIYEFIEKPIRFPKSKSRWTLWLLFAMSVILTVGGFVWD